MAAGTENLFLWSDHLVNSVNGLIDYRDLVSVGWETVENLDCWPYCLFVYFEPKTIRSPAPIGKNNSFIAGLVRFDFSLCL